MMMMIVIPVAFVAGILVSVIIVTAFLFILNTIVINLMFLMNIAMILGKLLYGRNGSQIINYPHEPPFPYHFPPHLHQNLLNPLALKILKGKKLFLLAKLFKHALAKDANFFKDLKSESLSENQIRRNSEDEKFENFFSSFNESEIYDTIQQLNYRGYIGWKNPNLSQ